MNEHSPERLEQILSRADPPPIFYRYRPPGEFALREVTSTQVYATKVEDLNDPHEFRAPVSMCLNDLQKAYRDLLLHNGTDRDSALRESESVTRDQLELVLNGFNQRCQSSGLVCGTSDPRSNRMWAYYAGSHRGICIGYDSQHPPFCYARKVIYADPDGPLDLLGAIRRDPMLISDHISCRKGAEWAFENEYRIPVSAIAPNHPRLFPVPPEAIVEIRLGVNITPEFRDKVVAAAGKSLPHARLIQMGCDHRYFRLTETEI